MVLILGGIAEGYIGAPGADAWAIGTGIPVASLSMVFWLVTLIMRGTQSENPLLATAAVAAGRVGMVRVDGIKDTGTWINDLPLCELDITVQPRTGEPYRTKFWKILSFEKRASLVPGSLHPVAILIEGEPEVGILKPGDLSDPSLLRLPGAFGRGGRGATQCRSRAVAAQGRRAQQWRPRLNPA